MQIPAVRDRPEVVGIALVELRLHLDHEDRHERQNRKQCVEDDHIIARRIEECPVDEHTPRSLPYYDIRQKEPERIAERTDEEASMPPEIGEKGKEHPVARQSEAARHIEEEEECKNPHPHIHG